MVSRYAREPQRAKGDDEPDEDSDGKSAEADGENAPDGNSQNQTTRGTRTHP